MNASVPTLHQLADDLTQHWAHAKVDKLWGYSPNRIYLQAHHSGVSALLVLDPGARKPQVGLVSQRPEVLKSPPGWQFVMRKHLVDARFEKAQAQQGQLWLFFQKPTKTEQKSLLLVNEDQAWLLLTDERRILAVAANQRKAEWKNGSEYAPATSLNGQSDDPPRSSHRVSLNNASTEPSALRRMGQLLEETGKDERQRALHKQQRSQVSALQRTIEKVKADLQRIAQADQHLENAQWLQSHAALVAKGTRIAHAAFIAKEDGRSIERSIELNPAMNAQQNAERLFHQYRRMKRGEGMANQRLVELLGRMESLKAKPAETSTPVGNEERRGGLPPKTKLALPYRSYRTQTGRPIWVGKNAKKNDQLTFKFAKAHHWWLHVKGQKGTHVVLPSDADQKPDPEDLIDAAHLAVYHSESKEQTAVEVSYTQARFVKKSKGSAPGAVVLSKEFTLRVRIDRVRLQNLLQSATSTP